MKLIKAIFLVLTLSISASAFAISDDNYMSYTEALRDGNLKYVKKLLDSGDTKVDELFFGWTALQIATNRGQLAIVKHLVEKRGANMDYQHPISKNTAFHLAALNGHTDVVKYLAAKGADINVKLKAGVSIIRPLRDFGKTDMIDLLISLGVSEKGCEDECF